jgi:hypothetical protein
MDRKIRSFDDIVSRSLLVKVGKSDETLTPIDVVLADPETADRVVKDLLGLSLDVDPREAVRSLNEGPKYGENVPPASEGLGGLAVHPFLTAYSARFLEDRPAFRVKVGGKACDYAFAPNADNPYKGTGHLSINMLHEYFANDEELRTCTPSKTEFYHWRIKLCNAVIHRRYDVDESGSEHGSFPNNPFPDLDVTFPAPALDPNDPRSIWCRCLDHKLFIMGEDVKVEHIYRQICSNVPQPEDEDFHLLDRSDPLYKSTAESCVDIMFRGYPPLAGLPEQREYCIGRCGHPDLVNTGA